MQTPEPVVSAAGSFARLQNFYNTIHQHLQFIANIRESGIWRPDSPTSPQRTPNGLDRRSVELIRRAYGLRREQGRMSVPAVVPAGIPSLAGAAVLLAAGNPSGLPRYDTARRDAVPPTAGELDHLEDEAGSAVMNGAADAAAESRGIRREAGQLERAIAAQVLRPDAWAPLFFAWTLYPDAREPIRSAQALRPDAGQPPPSARMLRRGAWSAMPGLDLWKQGAGGNLSGREKAAGWPPRPIPQRPGGAERPRPGGGKATFAPSGGIPDIGTAASADRVHWGKNRWSISRLSAASDWPGAEGQGTAVLRQDTPTPTPLVGGELAHRIEPEGENLSRQGASQTGPAGRGALGERTISTTAIQSAPVLQSRTAPGLGGVTAQEAGPVGANAAAREAQPAADAGELPSVFLEEARPSSLTVGTWPRTERKERSVLPPFSKLPGEELAHRVAPIGSEWDFGSGLLAGRTQTSADRARTSPDKAQTSAGRIQTSTDRVQTAVGGAQISSDIPARLLEAADAAQHGKTPQGDSAAGQSKPPVSALRDIRAVKAEQGSAEPGRTLPGTSQTGEPLSALFGPGAELIHSAGLDRDSVLAPEEGGARAPAVLTAQAKGHRPQADSPQEKTRREKPAAQTGGRGTQSGAPWGQIRIGAAAGSIEQAEEIAALRYVPLVVDQMQGLLTGSLRDIRPFAAGRAGLTAGSKAPQEGQFAAPYHEILPPGEMTYGVESKDMTGADVEALREGRAAEPYYKILPPGEMIYGAQKDMTGAGKDARSHAAPSPLELTYGGTPQPAAAGVPAPAAGGQKPVQGSMESDYVRDLPDWARRFLREGAPQTQEEAVRRLGTGREQPMGTAQNIAVLSSFSEEAGTAFQWTAPDTRAPAPVEYREPRRQQELSQPQSIRISEAEVQRTADRVYRIIEDRIRRERWRLGL